MDSKIPLPTDNVYKFLALFGLALFITGGILTVQIGNATNEIIFESFEKNAEIDAKESLTPRDEKLKQSLEKKVEITIRGLKSNGTKTYAKNGEFFMIPGRLSILSYCQTLPILN